MTERNLNRRYRLILAVLAFTSAAAVILAGWALYERSTDTGRVWHAVVCSIETAVQKQHLPRVKERAALRFYDRLLTDDVHTSGCGLR
jgi:hypothetical protein